MVIKTRIFAALLWVLLHVGVDVVAMVCGKTLPLWEEGFLDIHHINTGCGECAFCILPDGTTLLIDAGGRISDSVRKVSICPNDSLPPGIWIAHYIAQHFPQGKVQQIDYFLSTHFHADHLEAFEDVAKLIPIDKIIDRDYPTYNLRRPSENERFFYRYLDLTK